MELTPVRWVLALKIPQKTLKVSRIETYLIKSEIFLPISEEELKTFALPILCD